MSTAVLSSTLALSMATKTDEAVAATAAVTRFVFEGEAGARLVGGRNVQLDDGITAVKRGDTAPYEFFYAQGSEFFDAQFSAPDDSDRPRKGLYQPVERAGDDRPNGVAGLNFFGGGLSCASISGSYIVDQAAYDANGTMTAFAARFQQSCDGSDAATFGAVAYNATVPVYGHQLSALSLAFPAVASGARSDPQTITITNTSTTALPVALVSLGGAAADQFQIVRNRCDGASITAGESCTVDVVFAPTTGGPASARLLVADAFTSWGASGQEGEAIALAGGVVGVGTGTTVTPTVAPTDAPPTAVATPTAPATAATTIATNETDTTASATTSASAVAPSIPTDAIVSTVSTTAVRSVTTVPAEEVTTIAQSTSRTSGRRSRTGMLVLLVLAIATTIAAVLAYLRRSRQPVPPSAATPPPKAEVLVPDSPRIIDASAESTMASTIGEARRAAPRPSVEPTIAATNERAADDEALGEPESEQLDEAPAAVAAADEARVDADVPALRNASNAVHVIDDDESLDELDLAAFGSTTEADPIAATGADAAPFAIAAGDDDAPLLSGPLEPASMVCVLGPPVVLGRDDLSERTVEVAVRLAVEPHGVSVDDLGGALGHGGLAAPQARSKTTTLVSRARGQLGELDGEPVLPKIARGEPYRLHRGVVTDLTRFEQLVDSAAHLPPAAAAVKLRSALSLVRGRPFGDAPYAWAVNDGWVGRAQQVVGEAAHRLADLALDADDLACIWFAVDKGLLANPDDEHLTELLENIIDRETPT